jgi:AcrR family transcriptional regulator
MESSRSTPLTPKAVATRQRILDTALRLFAMHGYEQTSMRDVAAAAGCSLGLAYRYFASKEDLVLALYLWLVAQLEALVDDLPAGSMAHRFDRLLHALLPVMAPHRLTLIALSGAALNPLSRAGVFGVEGAHVRHRARAAYVRLIAAATDAPGATQVDDLATLLYGAQLAVVLFWLQDLSSESRKTDELLAFMHTLFRRLRPLLRVPSMARLVARFAQIIGPLLGREQTSSR